MKEIILVVVYLTCVIEPIPSVCVCYRRAFHGFCRPLEAVVWKVVFDKLSMIYVLYLNRHYISLSFFTNRSIGHTWSAYIVTCLLEQSVGELEGESLISRLLESARLWPLTT